MSEEVTARRVDLPDRLRAMHDILALDALPQAEPGKHCGEPHECEFWDRCTADKPADWIAYLPRLTPTQSCDLEALGITTISAIPGDFPLAWKQEIIRDALASGRPYVASDLARLLHGFGLPACFLDFEAMMPPIALYEGTWPYQTLPFQWSLHVMTSDGKLAHQGFLASANGDPRLSFAETMVAALAGSDMPIIVYSAYEQTRLSELAVQFPDLAPALNDIMARLVDFLPLIRGAVYLPSFGYSNSIKSVAPALSPGFGYDDLEDVADGSAAAGTFALMASGKVTDPADVARLRAALLAYCERDTMAMVEVHRALKQLAVDAETDAHT